MKNRKRKTERNLSVCSMRAAGLSYRDIAEHHGISIVRVRQILEVWEKVYENQET